MKKLIILLIFSTYLFSNNIYLCSGFGKTQIIAMQEAKKSALEQSSSQMESSFSRESSISNRVVKDKISFNISSFSKGVVSIQLEISLEKNSGEWEFKGVCQIDSDLQKENQVLLERIIQVENKIQSLDNSENNYKLNNQLNSLKNLLNIFNLKIEKIKQQQNQNIRKLDTENRTKILKIISKIDKFQQKSNRRSRELDNKFSNLESMVLSFQNQKESFNIQNRIQVLEKELSNVPDINQIKKEFAFQISQNFRTTNIRISKITKNIESKISDLETSQNREILKLENNISQISQDLEKLENRVSLLEKYQTYIFGTLGGFGILIIFLFLRRPKQITIEKVADISVISKKIKISTEKKIYFQNEKLKIEFSNFLEKEMYFYIIDINMRDETTLIYPAQSDNNLLFPNSKRELPKIEIVPPFGKDILKIIASPIPLKIPNIVYGKSSKVFKDSRGFSNPNIVNIEKDLAKNSEISEKDILAHFRGQALNGGFTIFENFVEVKTRE